MTYPGDNATAPSALDAFPSVGHALRDLRMQRGWSIVDVSARLKFAPRQLEALENEDWSKLPRGSSLRGLVRNYARLLDIDPEPLLTAVEGPAHAALPRVTDASVAASIPTVSSTLPPSATRRWSSGGERRRGVGVFGIVLVLIAVGACYAVFQERLPEQYRISRMLRNDNAITPPATISGAPGTLSSSTPAVVLSQPDVRVPHPLEPAPVSPGANASSTGPGHSTTTSIVPPATMPSAALVPSAPTPGPTITPPASTPAPTAAAPVAPAAPAASANAASAANPAAAPRAPIGSSPLVVRVVNDSWVDVRGTNGVLVSQVLTAGTERSFDVVPPAKIVVGNAGGATVSWQGKPVDLRSAQRDNVARLTLQ